MGQETDKYVRITNMVLCLDLAPARIHGLFLFRRYITYFMDRIQALIQNGITPYVVFDGGPLPMKKGTEEERRAYVSQPLPHRCSTAGG